MRTQQQIASHNRSFAKRNEQRIRRDGWNEERSRAERAQRARSEECGVSAGARERAHAAKAALSGNKIFDSRTKNVNKQ